MSEEFLNDLNTLTSYLTDHTEEYTKTKNEPEKILMKESMFLTSTFKELTKHTYGKLYNYIPKEKRFDCDCFDMLAQLLTSVSCCERIKI